MATASLDQARVVAFALEHGTSAAARRFRVSDSYVRRLKRSVAPAAQAGAPVASARPGLRLVSAPSVPVSRFTEAYYSPLANYAGNGRSFWRCPVCDEFVRSPVGARRNDWQEEQKRLHSHLTTVPAPAVMSGAPAPTPDVVVPVLAAGSEASQSDSSVVPVPVLGSAGLDVGAGDLSVATVLQESSSRFAAVMAFVRSWLAEYWRVPLAVGLALVVICLCISGVR